MNFKRTMRFSGVAVCICSASLADNADAQTAGSITTSVGWLHIAPQGDATPLIVQSVGGVTVNRQLAGTGAHASSTDTLGITTEYYVTDNLGVAMLLGMPLKVNLIGDGTLQKYGTLGTTRPMPPAIELRYHLFLPRRNSGRTWASARTIRGSPRFGQPTASSSPTALGRAARRARRSARRGTPCSARGKLRDSKHWSVGTSVNYMPVKTNLTLYGQTATGTQIVSKSTLRLNPLSVFLNVAYTF